MIDNSPDFISNCREYVQKWNTSDWDISVSQASQGVDTVTLAKDGEKIEIGYDPFGPPWCFVKEGDKFNEIEVSVPFDVGEHLANPAIDEPFDPILLKQHEQEIRLWFDSMEQLIRKEL